MGFARDQSRCTCGLGLGQGAVDIDRIMAVAGKHRPARSGKAGFLVGDIGDRNFAINRDAIVIPQHNQVFQLVLACQRQRLLADALHQAAIARHHIGAVALHLGPQTGAQVGFGHGKAHRIGKPLAQGPCRGFNASGMAVFWMPRRAHAPLAKALDLVQRDIGVARQIQHRIQQHRPVPCRQDEPVAVGPMRGLGVKLQVLFKQNRCHIGHAHGHARVAGVGGSHRVQRQGADGAGGHPMLGVAGAQGLDIHFGVLMLRKDQVLIADVHSSLWGKFKRRAENSVKNGLDAAGFASPS